MSAYFTVNLRNLQRNGMTIPQVVPTFSENLKSEHVDEVFRCHLQAFFRFLVINSSFRLSLKADPENFTKEKIAKVVRAMEAFASAIYEDRFGLEMKEKDLALSGGPTLFSDMLEGQLKETQSEREQAAKNLEQTALDNHIQIELSVNARMSSDTAGK
ncbi:MAG: hypothetical protein K1X28_10125 [Parachlamydiales bacterium]|nr:hypothetical protein [Parachlamydiales bacterium]